MSTDADRIREALRASGTDMTAAELADATGLDVETIRKQMYAAKQRGEVRVEIVDGKATYAFEPGYVPAPRGRRPHRGDRQAKAPAAAAPTAPATSEEAKASPLAELLQFLRATGAMADETLERAVRIPLPPPVILQLTQATKALHGATFSLIGAPQ